MQFEETSQLIDADLLENSQEHKRALDILEALTVLAINYEKKHYAISKPDPIIEAIKQRKE